MKLTMRIIVFSVVAIVLAGGLIWGFLAGRTERSAEAEREASVQAQSRVGSKKGKPILTFDAAAQHTNGIVTAPLSHDKRSIELQATGVVLQLQPILDLKSSYNTTSVDLVKARAAARASLAEYERLRQLNQDGKNASDKAVETARATSESDAALVQNVEQSIAVLTNSTRLHWVPVVASWLEQGSPQFDALLAQRMFLLQATVASNGNSAAPRQTMVKYADGSHNSAYLISTLPQLDPRLQAPSLLYVVAAHPDPIPRINLPVSFAPAPAR